MLSKQIFNVYGNVDSDRTRSNAGDFYGKENTVTVYFFWILLTIALQIQLSSALESFNNSLNDTNSRLKS